MIGDPSDMVARLNAHHDATGQSWGVIEGSGMEDGDRWTGRIFDSHTQAVRFYMAEYEPDEVERMSVAVARWDRQGEFWSYDF